MDDTGTCAHEICNCPVTGDGEYCSQNCRDKVEQDMVDISCDCGHASCS